MRPNVPALAALLGLTIFTSACGDDIPPLGDGALQYTWQISPRGCEESGVAHVQINLEGQGVRREIFACDAQEGTLDSLAAGTYRTWVDGIDDAGKVIFTAPSEKITVRADSVSTVTHARLTAKPASFEVGWRFENGRVCGANKVTDIEVVVFDKADYEIARSTFDCDEGLGVVDGFTAGTYLLEAVTIGTGARYHGLATVSVDRGDVGEVEVVLSDMF